MIRIHGMKSKSIQYVIGGVVAVIILIVWVSLPLVSNSPLDSSMAAGNPFRSKVADIGALTSGIPSEAGAPGSPMTVGALSGQAALGESITSSLFQSGLDEESSASAGADASLEGSAADGSGPSDGYSASAGVAAPGAPSGGGAVPKMTPQGSISGSNSNSMTAGSTHAKFFGGGSAKMDTARPGEAKGMDSAPAAERKNAMLAMLGDANSRSKLASKSADLASSRNGASAAFEKGHTGRSYLNTDMEKSAASAGLEMGQLADDLKRSDPSMNSTRVEVPTPKPEKDKESNTQMIMQMMSMLIQAILGPLMGALTQELTGAMATSQTPIGQ